MVNGSRRGIMVVSGNHTRCHATGVLIPRGDGYLRITAGLGCRMNPGGGRVFITADGILTPFTAGCGIPIQYGLQPGCSGVLPITGLAGHRYLPG